MRATSNFGQLGASILFALISFVLIPRAQAGSLEFIQNGSFETLTAGNTLGATGGYVCRNTGNGTCTSNVASWSSTCQGTSCGTGGTPDSILFGGSGGSAFNGGNGLYAQGQNGLQTNVPVPDSPSKGNYLGFDGDPAFSASIFQTITGLAPNTLYVLSFYQGAGQQKGSASPGVTTTEYWKVSFAGQTKNSTVMNNATAGWVPWSQQVLTFISGATGTETLSFLSQGTPAGMPPIVLLDGVSLTAAPEPQTFALIGIGLVAIPFLNRKRKA